MKLINANIAKLQLFNRMQNTHKTIVRFGVFTQWKHVGWDVSINCR